MKLVKENINFKRGIDSKKSLRIGANYAPGTMKNFEDVEPGDIAIDYTDEEHIVIDKIIAPLNSRKLAKFISLYDDSGVYDIIIEHSKDYGVEETSERQIIAVENSIVFDYEYDGAYVVW